MERLDTWRGEARQLGRPLFTARYHRPALLLRWVVEGELGRLGGPQSTHSHNVRGSLKDRLHPKAQPDRRPAEQERIVAVSHRAERAETASVFTVGRLPSADLFVNDYTVSSRHGRLHFMRRFSRWMLEDVGSTNGTWINGARLPPRERGLVASTDEVQLGRLVFLFLESEDLHRYLVGDY